MFNEEAKYKKWADWKAQESCFGEEIMELYQVRTKKAMKTCFGSPAPEIKLYEMMKPRRVVDAMLRGMKAKIDGSSDMKKMMKAMHKGAAGPQQPVSVAYVPYVPQQPAPPQPPMSAEMQFMMKMMKMSMMKNMMKKMEEEPPKSQPQEPVDQGRRFTDELEAEAHMDMSDLLTLLKVASTAPTRPRSKRNADLYDLGDELTVKLQEKKDEFMAKMGNTSCVMQEMGYIDNDLNLDLNLQLEDLKTYNIADPWFLKKNQDAYKKCTALAESIPTNIAEEFMGNEKWGRIKVWSNCVEECMRKACMQMDSKRMLEKHFSPLEDLIVETGMDEDTLLKLTMAIVDDSFAM